MYLHHELLEKIAEQHGSCFYIYYPERFRKNASNLLSSFRRIYSNSSLAYSYKTLYLPAVCALAHEMGLYAEVVSSLEYELARRLDIPGQAIVYNGPAREYATLRESLLQKSITNLDGFADLEKVTEICKSEPQREFEVGLRANFRLEKDRVSRFGFDVENGDLYRAVAAIEDLGNCRLTGLHCHYTVPDRSLDSYRYRTKRMLEIYSSLQNKDDLHYIDMGGGFYGPVHPKMKAQIPHEIPSFDDYAGAVAEQFKEYFDDGRIELILEPGVSVVADVLEFATKVIDIKRIKGRNIATCTGSAHHVKPSFHPMDLAVEMYAQGRESDDDGDLYDIAGFTCLDYDYLRRNFSGKLEVGDWLVFKNVGAYTLVMKSPFIKSSPAVVSIGDGEEIRVEKAEESFDQFFSSYRFE
jgi:diaminopimelate decarboxylase